MKQYESFNLVICRGFFIYLYIASSTRTQCAFCFFFSSHFYTLKLYIRILHRMGVAGGGHLWIPLELLNYDIYSSKIEEVLWYRERDWQVKLFTVTLEWTVPANFTAKSVMNKKIKSLFQLLDCYYSTSSHIPLFLTINCPVTNV